MSISMWLVLAIAPLVATAFVAPPQSEGAGRLRQVDAIPMTWRIERRSDSEAGAKSCLVISLGGNVTARLSKRRGASAGTWSVRVGYDNQPGSVQYLRINKKYFQTDRRSFRGSDAAEIVELLKAPGVFAFEWGQRPDYSKRGGLFATGDFAAKAARCERWMGETRI